MEPLARERRLTIALDVAPGLLVSGSFDHLLRALINLLDNAINYGDSPGRILVEGRRTVGGIRLNVANDGRVLDATLLERVGERFLRGAAYRSRETGGVDLGLAIVAERIDRVQGQVHLCGLKR